MYVVDYAKNYAVLKERLRGDSVSADDGAPAGCHNFGIGDGGCLRKEMDPAWELRKPPERRLPPRLAALRRL